MFFNGFGSIASPGQFADAAQRAASELIDRRIKHSHFYYGEFDPSSGRTLAAGLTHASRTRTHLRVLVKWRTGE